MTTTLLRFELGGERRFALAGAIVGVLFSFAPLDLLLVWFGRASPRCIAQHLRHRATQ